MSAGFAPPALGRAKSSITVPSAEDVARAARDTPAAPGAGIGITTPSSLQAAKTFFFSAVLAPVNVRAARAAASRGGGRGGVWSSWGEGARGGPSSDAVAAVG